ncbi:MAG: hypothetical protein JXA78_17980 [Anaerolineales bacterium]|nr:hypothetical protein [Anaerolineales bacterium]
MSKTKVQFMAAILALLLAALACNFSASTANISDAWMARDEAGTERTTVFAPGDTFYAKVELDNAPDDTTVKATWAVVEAAGLAANTFLDEAELTQGSGELTFSLVSDQPWSAGKYKVDLHLDGELERTLEFEVRDEAPAPLAASPVAPSGASISDAYMSRDQVGDEPTRIFDQADIFYAQVELVGAPNPVTVKAIWIGIQIEGEEPDTLIYESELSTDNGGLYFELSNSELWPPGRYKVDIYVDNVFQRTLEFEVQAEGTGGAASALLADVYLTRDPDSAEQTTVFAPGDTFYAIVELSGAPADTNLKAVWYAVQAEGFAPNELLDQAEIIGGDDTYTFKLTYDGPWPTGDYMVEIYLNGNLMFTLEFEVQ